MKARRVPLRSQTETSNVAIFLDKNSKVIVQGITGREGLFHTGRMLGYGTNIVGGVTPGKGGTKIESGQPVFNTVKDAVDATGATHSIIFVPPFAGADALWEAHAAGIKLAVCITEGIPAHDMLRVVATTPGMRIIGGNCPGLISPGKSLVGIMPGGIFKEGRIGMISRSGTLTYEIVDMLTRAGMGQSTCVGIGGDPIIGTTFVDCLRAFANDSETDAVVVSGEIGGSDEEDAAAFIKEHLPNKPCVAFIGGRSAPKGKRLGHAGAIISGNTGTPESKVAAFGAANVPVADRPSEIPKLLADRMKSVPA
jgi:succinyl-CoA synthetase alpha subunit